MGKKYTRSTFPGLRFFSLLMAVLFCCSVLEPSLPSIQAFFNSRAFLQKAQAATVTFTKSGGWFENAYAEWKDISGATAYEAYVKPANAQDSAYVKLDSELIRHYKDYWRVDAVGLKAGNYVLKVVAKTGSGDFSATTSSLQVDAFDRSGFGWVNGTSSGAYNEDGTLRSNAVVLYISQATVDTVKLDVTTSGKGAKTSCTGLVEILNAYKKGYDMRPLCIRIIGTVDNSGQFKSSKDNKGDLLISGNGSEASKRLSCGITVEGIGEDAVAKGWGIRIKNASNVEVRNLAFMLCNSNEGDNIGLQQDNDHIFVHNCDMFYGEAGSDSDQNKGDGALDVKKSTYVTLSYNHYYDTGKSNLLGLSEGTTEGLFITYHHNWYDHSDSRHPRVRYYSAHVYNNYYDGISKYGVGSTLGSSVFVEANYFRNCKYPMQTSMQGSDVYGEGTVYDTNNATFSKEDGGTIKAFNNIMTGAYTFIPYGGSTYTLRGAQTAFNLSGATSSTHFDAYVATSRNEQVPATVKSNKGGNTYNNFDTSASMYSYTPDTPENVPAIVKASAGRMNGGDFSWTFSDSADDSSYALNTGLMAALRAYKSDLISMGGSVAGGIVNPTATPTPVANPTPLPGISGTPAATPSPDPSATGAVTPVPGVVPAPGEAMVYTYGCNNPYFTPAGKSKEKGPFTVGGTQYKYQLKLDSGGSLTFTVSAESADVVIFAASQKAETSFTINRKKLSFSAAETVERFELTVPRGTHTIEKDQNGETWLIYVAVTEKSGNNPTNVPTNAPTATPTNTPKPSTNAPTGMQAGPTEAPGIPTNAPTDTPTEAPGIPTGTPGTPTVVPTNAPEVPTASPTGIPQVPTDSPEKPTAAPENPTNVPQVPTSTPQEPTAVPKTPTNAPDSSKDTSNNHSNNNSSHSLYLVLAVISVTAGILAAGAAVFIILRKRHK